MFVLEWNLEQLIHLICKWKLKDVLQVFALIFFTAFSFHITFLHFGIRKEKDKEQRKITGEKTKSN